ncbi:MAG: GLPGLI family protein [Flavobacteriales bacterium]
MKIPIALTAALLALTCCYGQQPTLAVTYAEKKTVSTDLSGIDNPAVREMVMKKLTGSTSYTLYTRDGISKYQKAADRTAGDSHAEIIGEDDIIYRDQKKRKFVRQTQFLSRNFLILDTLKNIGWTILSDTLKIGDYLCKKATANIEGAPKTAWFTDEIPVNEGPEMYFGLPGLILRVETEDKVITANKISFVKGELSIDPPVKGKEITAEKFKAIKKEKIKQLGGAKSDKKGVRVIKM